MLMPTRIVVADDHRLVRAGIVALLKDIPGAEVVGEAADGNEAVRLVTELKPSMPLFTATPGSLLRYRKQ